MALTALILVAVALVGAALLVHRYPNATRRWYQRFVQARAVVWTVVIASTVYVLLMTGSATLMALGAAMLFALVLGLYYEGGLSEVLS